MSTIAETALKAAYGSDTQDFLEHIAWTDVIKPKLLQAKEILTKELVGAVLSPSPTQNKEQIAGKVHGIDYAIRAIEELVREGKIASKALAAQNISFQ